MALYEEILQHLYWPELDTGAGQERSPVQMQTWRVPNLLQHVLAHLVVSDGQRSQLLRTGVGGDLAVQIYDGNNSYRVEVKQQATASGLEYGACITSYDLQSLLAILADVHDDVNHALRTVVITP